MAVRRAVRLVPMEARIAVMQVPMLSPKRIGTATSSVITPGDAIATAMRIPTVAELLWMMTVMTSPTSTPRTGLPANACMALAKTGLSRSGTTAWLITERPRNNSPNPSTTSPALRHAFRRDTRMSRKPTPMAGRAYCERSNAMSCAVMVVPMLAPMITLMA
ncbi:MAG: hypothetical protein BWY85_02352 [Firmicutes bacterium ADurb.Bin506]|nr:MAG: hypothetical protein BWY85_02352 [Firmicutes bacterium ADurb.Bin506]